MNLAHLLLGVLVLAPVLAALALAVDRGRTPAAAVLAPAASLVSLAAAIVLLALVVADGPARLGVGGWDPEPGLVADRLTVVLAILVAGVAATVQAFAIRALEGDPRRSRLLALTSAIVGCTLATVCAATFSGLVLAWCATSATLLLALAHRSDRPAARAGVRRTARAFALGDGALLAALALVLVTGPDLDLQRLSVEAPALAEREIAGVPVGAPVACLLVIAGLTRSALLPMPRWLAHTLAAPTVLSALLHAGIVNGAGVLLVRMAPVLALSPLAISAAFAAGVATAVLSTALMLVRPDVKGALVHSTSGQMGFMVTQVAVGAFAAAVFHLFAHGMYKATLFLGAGSAVSARRRGGAVPVPQHVPGLRARALVAVAFPAAVLAAAVLAFPATLDHRAAPLLLLFAWAAAAHMTWGWLGSGMTASRGALAAGAAGLVAVVFGYVGLLDAAETFLAPALAPVPADAITPWIAALLIGAAALALTALRLAAPRSPLAARWWMRVYAALLHHAGAVAAPAHGPVHRAGQDRPAELRPRLAGSAA